MLKTYFLMISSFCLSACVYDLHVFVVGKKRVLLADCIT